MESDQNILTVREAAARLKLNPETIRRWIRDGRIRAVSLGSDRAGFRIPESEVTRLLRGDSGKERKAD
jgi:excisionase family DNA binding protein